MKKKLWKFFLYVCCVLDVVIITLPQEYYWKWRVERLIRQRRRAAMKR